MRLHLPPFDFDHKPGFEIHTKHKEAIRQLHGFGGTTAEELMARYNLSKSTIHHVLSYDQPPERKRPSRTGRPQTLTDARVDEIIEYLSETCDNRCLDWTHLRDELKRPCTPEHLARRLKQRGYFRCVACQKLYLTPAQVLGRLLWAITHIFWTVEWQKVLWSDGVTFLVGGRTVKQRVTRKKGERTHPTCIQQLAELQRKLAGAEERAAEEQGRREAAEADAEQSQPKTLVEYLGACHVFSLAIEIITDETLTTKGETTKPAGRPFTKRIVPWDDFPTRPN
jgi:transposase